MTVAVVAAALTAGCDGGGKAGSRQASTSPASTAGSLSPSTTAIAGPVAATKQAVLRAYRAFWDDVVTTARTADWQSPRLAAHATGQALQQARAHHRALKEFGLVTLGTIKMNPQVVTVEAATASVRDCQDLSDYLRHDAKTGALRDKPSGKRYLVNARLVREDDVWKVTTATQEAGKCAG
jgi:hypothetical protein